MTTHTLFAASLFTRNSHSSSSSNHTCPDKSLADPPQEHFVGSLSFHQVAFLASAACTVISCLICAFLIFRHATHYAVPKEQKQIIRIIFIIPVFAVCSLLSVAFLKSSIYILPITVLYESFALAAFFLYLLCCIQADDDERQSFFESSGQMAGYRKTALMVFQFPVIEFLLFILTEITEATGRFCATSSKPYFASVWVTIITTISTIAAVTSVLRFYKSMKAKVGERKPITKLLGFKSVVGLTWLQNIIFSFLASGSDLKPTSKMTYKDLTVAIPNLIVSVEMILFALLFLKIMGTREYNIRKGASAVSLGNGGYYGGFMGMGAIFDALNFVDIVSGIFGALKGGLRDRRGVYTATEGCVVGEQDTSYENVELIHGQQRPLQDKYPPPGMAGQKYVPAVVQHEDRSDNEYPAPIVPR